MNPTLTYFRSGSGLGSGTEIKWNTKVKKPKVRGQLSETQKKKAASNIEKSGIVLYTFCCWKTVLNIVESGAEAGTESFQKSEPKRWFRYSCEGRGLLNFFVAQNEDGNEENEDAVQTFLRTQV